MCRHSDIRLANERKQILILVITQIYAQNLFNNKFISCFYMFRVPCAHRQEVKIVLYSFWYHHTKTSEWSKITKINKITKIYKYEQIRVIVKLMCEFFGCDYCVLLIINIRLPASARSAMFFIDHKLANDL